MSASENAANSDAAAQEENQPASEDAGASAEPETDPEPVADEQQASTEGEQAPPAPEEDSDDESADPPSDGTTDDGAIETVSIEDEGTIFLDGTSSDGESGDELVFIDSGSGGTNESGDIIFPIDGSETDVAGTGDSSGTPDDDDPSGELEYPQPDDEDSDLSGVDVVIYEPEDPQPEKPEPVPNTPFASEDDTKPSVDDETADTPNDAEAETPIAVEVDIQIIEPHEPPITSDGDSEGALEPIVIEVAGVVEAAQGQDDEPVPAPDGIERPNIEEQPNPAMFDGLPGSPGAPGLVAQPAGGIPRPPAVQQNAADLELAQPSHYQPGEEEDAPVLQIPDQVVEKQTPAPDETAGPLIVEATPVEAIEPTPPPPPEGHQSVDTIIESGEAAGEDEAPPEGHQSVDTMLATEEAENAAADNTPASPLDGIDPSDLTVNPPPVNPAIKRTLPDEFLASADDPDGADGGIPEEDQPADTPSDPGGSKLAPDDLDVFGFGSPDDAIQGRPLISVPTSVRLGDIEGADAGSNDTPLPASAELPELSFTTYFPATGRAAMTDDAEGLTFDTSLDADSVPSTSLSSKVDLSTEPDQPPIEPLSSVEFGEDAIDPYLALHAMYAEDPRGTGELYQEGTALADIDDDDGADF